ncbi:MAG: hypothetical protein PHQ05_02525 [Sterolibacterium sp.]|nr:hypothetical protein [Sterolibacterium sp.]
MSFSFHPEAAEEFDAAVDWYEERSAGLGLDFAAEIRQAILRAESLPLAWTRLEGDIRRVLVHRFPYGILYARRRRSSVYRCRHAPESGAGLLVAPGVV